MTLLALLLLTRFVQSRDEVTQMRNVQRLPIGAKSVFESGTLGFGLPAAVGVVKKLGQSLR